MQPSNTHCSQQTWIRPMRVALDTEMDHHRQWSCNIFLVSRSPRTLQTQPHENRRALQVPPFLSCFLAHDLREQPPIQSRSLLHVTPSMDAYLLCSTTSSRANVSLSKPPSVIPRLEVPNPVVRSSHDLFSLVLGRGRPTNRRRSHRQTSHG